MSKDERAKRVQLRSTEEWAGHLSTKNFSHRHPTEALEFLLDFELFITNEIRKKIERAI